MFTDLPREIQRKVYQLLKNDDFVAAKELHDNWLANHHTSPSNPANNYTTSETQTKPQ